MAAMTTRGIEYPMQLAGVPTMTKPNSYASILRKRLAEFNGSTWQLFGDLIKP